MVNSTHNIYTELITIADLELSRLEKTIPDNPPFCFALLLEATRMYDYMHYGKKEEIEQYGLSFQVVDVMKSGWNLAVSFLFKPIREFIGIPVMASTEETKISVISLLYQFGCVTLLRRTAEMVKSGILITDRPDYNTYKFSISPDGKKQFLDEMEQSYLETLEQNIEKVKSDLYKNWTLTEHENLQFILKNYGSFLSKSPKDPFSNLKLNDLEARMFPLIKPWDSGKGIMMGYDSTEELDWHFMAIAANGMKECIDEAGIVPNRHINGIKTSDLIAVVTCLVSFNLKHIKFSSIASQKHKEISIFQSLTIWCSRSELISDISIFTGIEKGAVNKIFRLISLMAEDAKLLKWHTTKFMPLIIDLENDFVLRPVSSIIRNPLNTIKDIMTLRNPNIISDLIKGRESWLREYLYSLFMGKRYHRIEGSITLRLGRETVTDIDAAIYDIVTGELALFQIKWQDYHFNDVKKLRSKAGNLIEELDKWTRKVSEWIASQGVNQLSQNLRLPKEWKITETRIYLFGLSKNAVRMKGYGFELKEKRIAISTWAQFLRNRIEIGPSSSVFGDIYNALKQQESSEVIATAKPITFKILEKQFYYYDLWSVVED